MKHGTQNRRQRNRGNNGRRNNQPRMQVYDSNGPDVRIRGNAHQVAEKYLALAKDASSGGDRTTAENYYQHAEHYIRIINEINGGANLDKIKGLNRPVAENQGNRQEDRPGKPAVEAEKQDDLALPSSILGPEIPSAATAQREETVD